MNGFESVQNMIRMALKWLFFRKIKENRPAAEGFAPQQGRQYGTVRLNFGSELQYAGTVRLFCNGTSTVAYVGTVLLFVKAQVRYGGTLFELKIPDFSHIAPASCIQRQKTAETDAKYTN